jgi:hypothetical protein
MPAAARVALIALGAMLTAAAAAAPPQGPASPAAKGTAATPPAAPALPPQWLMPGLAEGKLTPAQIEQQLPDAHPINYYIYAEQLFQAGRKDQALQWFYAGQLRYRFLLKAVPGSESAGGAPLFDSLLEEFGPPLNHYGASDPTNWVKQIDAALQWDASNPNGYTSKTRYARQLHDARDGLVNFRAYIVAHADELRKKAEATPAPGWENLRN